MYRYIQTDSSGNEIELSGGELILEVKIQDLPTGTVAVSDLKIGAQANLSLQMEIYPPPRKDDYIWFIEDKTTRENKEAINIVQVKPGTYFVGFEIIQIKFRHAFKKLSTIY